MRVLLVPELGDASDAHEQTLIDLGQQLGHRSDVTIGVALGNTQLQALPASIDRAATRAGAGDLMLIERPNEADGPGWRRLLGGTSHFVPTAAQPALRALALSLGITPVGR